MNALTERIPLMKELRYLDISKYKFHGIICPEYDIEFAGTTISSMPDSYVDDTYRLFADRYDIHFIFESNLPVVDFYAVPMIDIFAMDSSCGYWGTLGSSTDIGNLSAKICYINRYNEVYIVADNLKCFLPLESVNKGQARGMIRTKEVTLFKDREEAGKVLKFIEPVIDSPQE